MLEENLLLDQQTTAEERIFAKLPRCENFSRARSNFMGQLKFHYISTKLEEICYSGNSRFGHTFIWVSCHGIRLGKAVSCRKTPLDRLSSCYNLG